MSNQSAPPTAAYIGELITALRSTFKAYHDEVNDTERLIHRLHQVYVPPVFNKNTNVQIIKTAIAEDIVRRVMSMETEGEPSYRIATSDDNPTYREKADHIEEWANAERVEEEKQSGEHTYTDHAYNNITYGNGALFCEYMPNSWDEYWVELADGKPQNIFDEKNGTYRTETKREQGKRLKGIKLRQPLPWYTTALDPRFYMWTKDSMGLREVLIGMRRPRLEVGLKYGINDKGGIQPNLVDGPNGDLIPAVPGSLGTGLPYFAPRFSINSLGEVDFFIYISRTYICYYCDGQLLKRVKHGYYRVPFFMSEGLTTSSRRPELRYRGIISPIKSLIKGLDQLLTMKLHWAGYGAYPMGVRKKALEAGGTLFEPTDQQIEDMASQPQKEEVFEWRPGQFVDLDPGEDFAWLQAPDVGRTLTAMIDVYVKMIEEAGSLPPVVKGYAQGTDQPGYAINQLLASARTVYEPIMGGIGTSYEELLEYKLWCIREKIGEKVYVFGTDPGDILGLTQSLLGVGPAEAKGPYGIRVNIRAQYPMRDAAQQQAGLAANDKKVISMYTLRSEFYGIENPDREQFRIDVEDLMNSPQFKQMTMFRIMQRFSMDQMYTQSMQQAGMDPSKMLPENGSPEQNALTGNGLPGGGGLVGPGMTAQAQQIPGVATNPGGDQQMPNSVHLPGGTPVNT